MKKIFAIALILSLLLVGCQNGNITDTTLPIETSGPDTQGGETDNQNMPYKFKKEYNIYRETEDYGFTLLSIRGIEKSEGVLLRGMEAVVYFDIKNLTNDSVVIERTESVDISVKLVCRTYDESLQRHIDEYVINRTNCIFSEDVTSVYEWAPGETMSTPIYFFTIPEHAIPGSYSVVCSYNGSTVEFEDIFMLD